MIALLEVLTKYVPPMAIFGIVLVSFELLDRYFSSPKAKLDFAIYLKATNFGVAASQLASGLRGVFEKVFGVKHFGLRCIVRSLLFSLCAVIGLSVMALLKASGTFTALPETLSSIKVAFNNAGWAANVIAVSIAGGSLVADYFNLLKTRMIIALLSRRTHTSAPFLALIFFSDCIIVFLVFILWIILAIFVGEVMATSYFFLHCPYCAPHILQLEYTLMLASFHRFPEKFVLLFSTATTSIFSEGIFGVWGVLFFAGLIPSIWLWLYIGSSLITRFAIRSQKMITFLKYFLPVNKHPFRSVGVVAATLALGIYLLAERIF